MNNRTEHDDGTTAPASTRIDVSSPAIPVDYDPQHPA